MSDDDQIGYGKPPKHSRFQPGRSGNPRGRPKGARNYRSIIQDTFGELIPVIEKGKPRRITAFEAIMMRLREKALKGDLRAAQLVLSLIESHAPEQFLPAARKLLIEEPDQLIRRFQDRSIRADEGPS